MSNNQWKFCSIYSFELHTWLHVWVHQVFVQQQQQIQQRNGHTSQICPCLVIRTDSIHNCVSLGDALYSSLWSNNIMYTAPTHTNTHWMIYTHVVIQFNNNGCIFKGRLHYSPYTHTHIQTSTQETSLKLWANTSKKEIK